MFNAIKEIKTSTQLAGEFLDLIFKIKKVYYHKTFFSFNLRYHLAEEAI